ncbi:hypothetical protein SAMN05216388_101665 [Halorientalis persicus]|uniref:Uncharacterized protein n=1 Tax=Halorientalis persicus TaxID=1367881 RepID=A0A1H8RHY3_9EURY|nr:hypothetical protein [Halorientalis persicus]SEO65754.1 hypothetical protein SAMN05216388_101665 [Halorientalis persicus]
MTARTRLLVGAAGAVLLTAAAIVLAPGLLPVPRSQLAAVMDTLTGTVGLAGLAVIAGLIAVVQGLWSSTTASRPPPLPVDGDPTARDVPGPVVGETFDERLAAVQRVDARSPDSEAVVREDLRRLATDVYQRTHRCDWETAARAVETGAWTDDRAAAAFVGGADAPDVPLRRWFEDMLSEHGAFHRQTIRTLRAIYALEGETDGDTASATERTWTADETAPTETAARDGSATRTEVTDT